MPVGCGSLAADDVEVWNVADATTLATVQSCEKRTALDEGIVLTLFFTKPLEEDQVICLGQNEKPWGKTRQSNMYLLTCQN